PITLNRFKFSQFNLNNVQLNGFSKKNDVKIIFLVEEIYDLNMKSAIFIIISFECAIFVVFLILFNPKISHETLLS
ncbi:hypothetical protein ACMBCN_03365, partial [Candidatus Liberibacter asiaticus]|nr:hypothetical protein [Candidatus Liberibacter asiaticus]